MRPTRQRSTKRALPDRRLERAAVIEGVHVIDGEIRLDSRAQRYVGHVVAEPLPPSHAFLVTARDRLRCSSSAVRDGPDQVNSASSIGPISNCVHSSTLPSAVRWCSTSPVSASTRWSSGPTLRGGAASSTSQAGPPQERHIPDGAGGAGEVVADEVVGRSTRNQVRPVADVANRVAGRGDRHRIVAGEPPARRPVAHQDRRTVVRVRRGPLRHPATPAGASTHRAWPTSR